MTRLRRILDALTGPDYDPWARAHDEDLADLKARAEQAEELLRIAHDTSNRAETERAAAVQRADQADEAARRTMEQRQQMAEERYAWQERGDRAEVSARAHKAAATEALERAEQAEAAITRVRELADVIASHTATWTGNEDSIAARLRAALAEAGFAAPVRCCVCGSPKVIHQVVTPKRLCGDCFLCHCGQTPCVRTVINDPAVSAEVRITTHTYQGADGGPCEADFYGQTCGAPRDDHNLTPEEPQ